MTDQHELTPEVTTIATDTPSTTLVAYTDGACSGNPGPGGWGFVLSEDHGDGETPEVTREVSGGDLETTNNRMEMTAAIKALEALPAGALVEVVTDSEYLMKGATLWLEGWKRKGWRNRKGKPVANGDLWETIDRLMETQEVSWRWVRGHNGDRWNERADELARRGVPENGLKGVL